ncbi:hypothetical protein H4I96_09818 [Botrytis cinerea]
MRILGPFIAFPLLMECGKAQDPARIPTNFPFFANGVSSAPYLANIANMDEFHKIKGNLTFNSQGPIHVYVNVGATQQALFLEGVLYNHAYVPVPLRTSGKQERPQIKPGEVLVEGNTEKFWAQGTAYTRRDIVQYGCNDNGTRCDSEGFRYRENGDIYNINEATFNPKGNGHVHAGGAHMDHSLRAYNHNQCRASSQHFSKRCKNSYAYAYDDKVGLRFCKDVPKVIYHFFNMKLDCDWAVINPDSKNLSVDSRECLDRLIQAPTRQDDSFYKGSSA